MIKNSIYVSVLIAGFSLALNSCGGSKTDDSKASVTTPPTSEASADDDDETGASMGSSDLNVESLTSAQDASNKYKEMIAEYAEIVKSGTAAEKDAYKQKMDELESYAKGKFSSAELKAMLSLTKLAVQLEAGKMVDLDAAYEMYGKALGESMKLLNSNEDINDAMEEAGDAVKDAQKDAEKAMQDAMDAYKL